MGRLFAHMNTEGKLSDCCELLDMLFMNRYMSNLPAWNRGYSAKYTKQMKQLVEIETTNQYTSKLGTSELIQIHEKTSIAFNVLRHIRNGIAHGHADIVRRNDTLYIELRDYLSNKNEKQTAYIYLSIDTLLKFYNVHEQISKSAMNTKSKDRKAMGRIKKNKTA